MFLLFCHIAVSVESRDHMVKYIYQ